jgi:hypothetical protein
MSKYDEDTLAQQTLADYLKDVLGWESVYAYNTETFGPEGTLGRRDDREGHRRFALPRPRCRTGCEGSGVRMADRRCECAAPPVPVVPLPDV